MSSSNETPNPMLDRVAQIRNERPQFGCMGFGCLGTTAIAIVIYLIIHYLRK